MKHLLPKYFEYLGKVNPKCLVVGMQLCIEFQRGFFRDIHLVYKNVEFELKRNNVLSKWDVGNNDLAYLKKMFKF